MIRYDSITIPSEPDLRILFDSVMWAQNLDDEELQTAIDNSSHLITAWDGSTLIGLIRSMDDNIYSATIDLLLVKKEYQNQGIATNLINQMKEMLKHIKFISTSPDDIKNFKLYQRCGFKLVEHSGQLQLHN